VRNKFGYPVEVSEISVQNKKVPRILWNGLQAVVEHAAFPRARPAQLRTDSKAGQYVVNKENPSKGAVGFTHTVGLYAEMGLYLLACGEIDGTAVTGQNAIILPTWLLKAAGVLKG